MTDILMFAGSARKDSYNKKLINIAAEYAKELGINVTVIDLADYPMPIYNGDIEAESGAPENAQKLYKLIESHKALLIASPEYNGLPSPLLKNTIDWVSRINMKVYAGKFAAIISASIGGLGGLRGLPHLRTLLSNINVIVIPQQAAIGFAEKAFDQNDQLVDKQQQVLLTSVINELIDIMR